MRCRVIRDDIEVSPQFSELPELQPLIVRKECLRNGGQVMVPFWVVGAELEHSEAFWAVRQGWAVPADDACRQRVHRNPLQLLNAQKAYDRLVAGIDHEDYDLFDAGVIEGYNPDGSYKPGVNWNLLAEMRPPADEEPEEEDDE